MKKIYNHITTFLLIWIAFTACEENIGFDNVENPVIDITVTGITEIDPVTGAYVIDADDIVNFEFAGEFVDNILFYSGEPGYDFAFRDRYIADKDAELKPTISIKTAVTSPQPDILTESKFTFLVSSDLKEFTDEGVTSATWKEYRLRGQDVSANSLTEYFNFTDGMVSSNGTFDYEQWYANEEVAYAIRAKSNRSEDNRLKLQEFIVTNTETRDYSYTYDGETKEIKRTRAYTLISALSNYSSSLNVNNEPTAASWASYNPLVTIREGESEPIANSTRYVWNVGELGLNYGEGSGYPWVRVNSAKQPIKGIYDIEIKKPTDNITYIHPDGTEDNEPFDHLKDEPCESWIISRKHLTRLVTPDNVSTVVKSKIKSMIWEYSHPYSSPGLYTATFYVFNQNEHVTKEKVIEFKILVR